MKYENLFTGEILEKSLSNHVSFFFGYKEQRLFFIMVANFVTFFILLFNVYNQIKLIGANLTVYEIYKYSELCSQLN